MPRHAAPARSPGRPPAGRRFRRLRRAALTFGVLIVSACLLSAAKTNRPVAGYPDSPQAAEGRFRNPAARPAEGVAKTLGIMWNFFIRSEEHTSELQSLMRISYAVFCLKKKKKKH